MATFEHPGNKYREEVNNGSVVLALLFGWLYFIVKGLWPHAAAQAVIVALSGALTGGPGVIILLPLWVAYAFAAPSILRRRYLRDGWVQID